MSHSKGKKRRNHYGSNPSQAGGIRVAPSAPEKKIPQFQAPRKKRKWVKRLIIILVIVALLAFLLSRCMGAGQQALSSVYLPYTAEMRDMTVSSPAPAPSSPSAPTG